MQTEAPSAAAEILLLAEDAGEASLIRQAADGNCLNIVEACSDVLSYLRRQQPYDRSVRPDLILLDLDVSKPDECATLTQIKQDDGLKRIPIVVLAPSDSAKDIIHAYDLHANAYIVKPKDQDEFVRVVRATLVFWLTLARLPRE